MFTSLIRGDQAATKSEYILRFGYDKEAFTTDYAQIAVNCLSGMAKGASNYDLRLI